MLDLGADRERADHLSDVVTGRQKRRRKPRGGRGLYDNGGGSSSIFGFLGRVLLFFAKIFIPVALLVGVAAAVLYVRLLNGPISLSFLSTTVAESISAELDELNVSIADFVVELRGRSFEFRLRDIRLADASGKPVAVAPLAAVEVSRTAFLAGQLAPSRIVLIEPQMLMFYSQESGLSLSLAQTSSASKPSGTDASRGGPLPKPGISPAPSPSSFGIVSGRIDLAKTIVKLAAQARSRSDATSYLDQIGVRDGTLVIDQAGTQTAWRVSTADFRLAHFDARSVIEGDIAVASRRGPWRIAIRAEESELRKTVRLTTTVRDIIPETVAEALPGLSSLKTLQFPISGRADLALSSQGELLAGNFDVSFGSGTLSVPWLQVAPPRLDQALIRLRYRRGGEGLEIAPSVLRWSGSDITVAGRIKQRQLANANVAWDFKLQSNQGRLGIGRPGEFIRLKRWIAEGTMLPGRGVLNLDKVISQAGDGELAMKGAVYTGKAPGITMSGRIGPMLARNFLGFWPEILGADARKWASKNVLSGQLQGASFSMRMIRPPGATKDTKSDYSMTLDAVLANARFVGNPALPPVYAEKANLSLKDDAFRLSIPRSAFVFGDDRSLNIDNVELTAERIFEPSVDGETKLRVSGDLHDAVDIIRSLGVIEDQAGQEIKARATGKIDSQFRLTLPFVRPGALPPPSVIGQVRILNGKVKNIWKDLSASGRKVIIDVAENGWTANGQLMIGRIATKFRWQRFFNSAEARQPPIRVTAVLDEKSRSQLGLQVNHMVRGPMGLDVAFAPKLSRNAQRTSTHVRLDLTRADLEIESLAWRKAAGKQAIAEFDYFPSDGQQTARLDNIRVDGGGLAVRGSAKIDRKDRLTSFDFTDFTLDVVTRLKVKGELRKGNVWRVSARGPTYEGRELFKQLFSTNTSKNRAADARQPGLDLDVQIGNVLGFWQTSMKNVRLDLSKRGGKIAALSVSGALDGGKNLRVLVRRGQARRQLIASSNDAGQVFKLIGFYPNIRGGTLQAIVDLDRQGKVERAGDMRVRKFSILGDPILSEVIQSQSGGARRKRRSGEVARQVIEFDWMRIPFETGKGDFVITDAEMRGQVHGLLLCGRADFSKRRVRLSGTYVPLQGLSAAFGFIPGFGQVLTGAKSAGIIGVNFEVVGSMQKPEVLINPLSLVTPGIFRELFKAACPKSQAILGKSVKPKPIEAWSTESFWGPGN